MKRVVAFLFCVVLLTGCRGDQALTKAIELRESVLASDGCSFDAKITADYGDKVYTFRMDCQFDNVGNLNFSVIEPDSIAGITGEIREGSGNLTFDDQLLAFPLLADEQITPVSSPWIFMKALRSGYIHSCAQGAETIQICVDDSYRDDAMQVDIYLNSANVPQRAEILWKNRRILSIEITDFVFL